MKQSLYNKMLPVAVFLGFLAVSGSIRADDSGEATSTETPRYLAPEEITREDYDMMSNYASRYAACLDQTSMEQMNNHADPRRVVDYAMKQCAAVLEELDRKMTERNIDPAYRQGFIGKINHQAVNNT
ncbi:MAG: hypothetical protein ACRESK_05020, partial [Gammaproteobacteria bacterium]